MAKSLKIAKLRPPDQAEREYSRLLQWYVSKITAETKKILIPKLATIVNSGEIRADNYIDDIVIVLAELADAITLHGTVLEAKLPSIFALMARNNDRALILAVKAATGQTLPPSVPGLRPSLLGVDLYRGDPWLKDMQEAWIRQNVSLVKSIGTQYHDRLNTIIQNGVFNGSSVRQISEQIQEQFGVNKKRAVLIAQDQILSANARITQIRAESIGVREYIWETIFFCRVRPAHAELDGKKFSWDKPHPTEGHPGSRIRCRCYAGLILPDFDE
jgi:SPP1 gp7 family putative phage head morphogenesis protein